MKVMLDKGAILPRSAHHQDAGYDLFTPRRVVLPANGSVDIDTPCCLDDWERRGGGAE